MRHFGAIPSFVSCRALDEVLIGLTREFFAQCLDEMGGMIMYVFLARAYRSNNNRLGFMNFILLCSKHVCTTGNEA